VASAERFLVVQLFFEGSALTGTSQQHYFEQRNYQIIGYRNIK
jgi:hypothetical protein